MLRFHVPDMNCDGCVNRVTRAVRSIDPNATVDADLATRDITVTGSAGEPAVRAALTAAGYPPRAVAAERA